MRTFPSKKDIPHAPRYFADKKGNRVYAVDVYFTVGKCMVVEAKDEAAAEEEAKRIVRDALKGVDDMETCSVLRNLGFHDVEESEYHVSGETNKEGEIEYY